MVTEPSYFYKLIQGKKRQMDKGQVLAKQGTGTCQVSDFHYANV